MNKQAKEVAEIYYDLFEFMTTYNHRIWRTATLPLPLNYFGILCYLEARNKVSITGLAEHLAISKQQMSTLIEKLQKQELVVKEISASDRRYSEISLSDYGRKFLQQHQQTLKENFLRQITNLKGYDVAEFANSVEVVKTVVSRMFEDIRED